MKFRFLALCMLLVMIMAAFAACGQNQEVDKFIEQITTVAGDKNAISYTEKNESDNGVSIDAYNADHQGLYSVFKDNNGTIISEWYAHYDEDGNQTFSEVYNEDHVLAYRSEMEYEDGNMTSRVNYDKDGKVLSKIVYTYYESGSQKEEIVYDGDGNEIERNTYEDVLSQMFGNDFEFATKTK